MRQRTIVAFAVFASLLVVTSIPVTASHGQLAVGSQHTDFGTGEEPAPDTLTNLTIDGSGDAASVKLETQRGATVEDFESGSLSSYGGDTGDFQVQGTTVVEGSYALERTATSGTSYISDTDVSLEQGNTYQGWVRHVNGSKGASGVVYFTQDETNTETGYHLRINPDGNTLELYKAESGSFTLLTEKSVSLSGDTWYELEWSVSSSAVHTVAVYNQNGDELVSMSATDSTFTSGGLGFRGWASTMYADDVHQLETASSGQYISANHSVSNAATAWTNLSLSNSTATVEALGYNESAGEFQVVNSSEFSSSGNYTLDISGTSFDTWRANVSFNKTGSNPVAELHDEGILVETHEPAVNDSSLSPNTTSSTQNLPVTLSANISDADFGTSYEDNATVYWYVDGEQRGTTTASTNGTVEFTLDNVTAGTHDWHIEVEDEFNHRTVSAIAQFAAPSKLSIYHETQPEKLVKGDNLSLTVRFYPLEAGSSTDVVTRNVTDGVANLSGLPADQRFVVTVKAQDTSNYTYRRIVVDSLFDSDRIYLLNESEPHSQVVFELEDPTGQFPPEETILYVEKPIEVNNSTTYQTIAGDTFGSTASFPAVLQRDERYRLRVETADGSSQRILGAYTVYGATVEPLQIQRIEPNSNVDAGSTVYGSLDTYNGTPSVAVRFRDLANNSTEVTYQVRQGDTVIVENTTSSADSFAHIHQVTNASGEYTVEYWIEHPDGVTTHDSFTVGEVPEVASRFNINPQVLSITSWIMILATMGLLAIVDAKLAPMGGTGMASGLVILGTVAIPSSILGVAGAISVLTLFGGDQ